MNFKKGRFYPKDTYDKIRKNSTFYDRERELFNNESEFIVSLKNYFYGN